MGQNVPDARPSFQKRPITGEIGADGGSAGFDSGPHNHVHDNFFCIQSSTNFCFGEILPAKLSW